MWNLDDEYSSSYIVTPIPSPLHSDLRVLLTLSLQCVTRSSAEMALFMQHTKFPTRFQLPTTFNSLQNVEIQFFLLLQIQSVRQGVNISANWLVGARNPLKILPLWIRLLHIHSGQTGILFALLLRSLWWVQIVGYVLACRPYSFVCTSHHLIIIIEPTYLKTLNL